MRIDGCALRRITLLSLLLASPAVSSQTPRAEESPVRYMVVVTGGELLAGAYADGHTFFITKTLRPLGLQCVGSMGVDDKQADLKDALRFAMDRATLVIVTGGLGPTDNDITRETLRDFTGIALREHPDVLAAMARRFNVPPDELRPNLRRQTLTPERGTYLQNANGTAVGLVFEMDNHVVVALPGPPRELQPMVRDELAPYLSRRFGTHLPGASITLRFVGLGQSQIDQTLKDHVPLPADITTSSQFEGGRVDFTFSLPQDSAENRARLSQLGDRITEHLGDWLYARDETTSLETCVMRLLETRGETLTLVEVGTGGSLAAALNGVQGTRHALIGSYIAPTTNRLHQMLGGHQQSDTAREHTDDVERLAHEAAATAGSHWVIATGEARRDVQDNSSIQVA
ncbi:MAG: molybdopterin-binding protein, partial [Phycisphaerales bacterium]